jgi:ABC-type spermidine/putrescine transport system permease subunit I
LSNYGRIVENPSYLTIFKNTFLASTVITLLAIALGYPSPTISPPYPIARLRSALLWFWSRSGRRFSSEPMPGLSFSNDKVW